MPWLLPLLLMAFLTAAARADEQACALPFSKLQPGALEKLTLIDDEQSLFARQMAMGSAEDAEAWNLALIRALDGLPKPPKTPGRKAALTEAQRKQLHRMVDENAVASNDLVDKYAPNGGIGFCFGRAITAHIEALRMGLDKDSIRKLWIVGHMRSRTNDWGHHVSTIVRGRNGRWYTVDPNYSKPMLLEDWLRTLQRNNKHDGRLQLFVTDAQRFGPDGALSAGPILPGTVKDPFYNSYFVDLMGEFRKASRDLLEQKRMERGSCPITAGPCRPVDLDAVLKKSLEK